MLLRGSLNLIHLVLLVLASGVLSQAHAEPFSKITIAINSAPGGGYDAFARLTARHLAKHLDGNPTIVPANMPGAGGLVAANWLYRSAPKDGSAIGILASSAIFAGFLGSEQARYDASHFNWLASLEDYHGIGLVMSDAPVQKAEDLLARELLVGAAGEGSDVTIWPNLIRSIIGAKLKLVRGYNGTPQIFLAMERGEVQSVFGLTWAAVKRQRAAWVASKKARIVLQISMERHAELPDVPTVLELATRPEDRAVLALFVARQTYGKPFLAPPGVPPAAVEALRQGFAAMAKDPDFLADAAQAGLDVNLTSGTRMKDVIDAVLSSPRDIVQRAVTEFRAAR